jgi:hypothetical protein
MNGCGWGGVGTKATLALEPVPPDLLCVPIFFSPLLVLYLLLSVIHSGPIIVVAL